MPKFSVARLRAVMMNKKSKCSRKKKSAETEDKALDLQLQDEEYALQLLFEKFTLDFVQGLDPLQNVDRLFSSTASQQAPSSSSTRRSKTLTPESVAVTEEEADCRICMETLPESSIISTDGCSHEYCFDCLKRHAEAKLMSGSSQIKCPATSCRHHFNIEQCKQLLSESHFDILHLRLIEAAIPAERKVHCPGGEYALQQQFEEFTLVSRQELDPLQNLDRLFSSTASQQAPSPSSTSKSKTLTRESVAVTEEKADFWRLLGIFRTPDIPRKDCGICMETLPETSFISTDEAKLMSGSSQIKCPDTSCGHHFDIEQCRQLLSESHFDILDLRLIEAAIPAERKVYCPYGDCSAFMEKPETGLLEPFTECYTCHRGFCQKCNVPWHLGKTCDEHCAHEMNTKLSGDQKLRDLAKQEKWRQCGDCLRMIERIQGCKHITCLCGVEFCYTCGAKWVHNATACNCKLFG